MNNILINLGFIKIYWYSFLIFLGLLIGGYLSIKEAKRFNIKEDFIIDYLFYLLPISIIGARLYYVIFNIKIYKNNFIEIFKIWNGGLAIHGGIIFGLLFTIYYCKKHKISVLKLTDIICVPLILAQAIGRWGNFFNQEAHGPVIALKQLQKYIPFDFIIDGMKIGNYYYQPTFLYESVWCFLGFLLLIILRRVKNIKLGQITSLYLIWYGIGRFFIESLRTDSLMLGNIKMAQVISFIYIICGLFIFIKNINKNLYNERIDKNV